VHEMVGMTHIIANDVPVVDAIGASHLSWLSIGTKVSRAIETTNGISVLLEYRSDVTELK